MSRSVHNAWKSVKNITSALALVSIVHTYVDKFKIKLIFHLPSESLQEVEF